jgi:hypothetical protein
MQRGRAARIAPGAGIQHAQQAGERGDAAHRGTCAAAAPLLLERYGRWQALDGVHLRHAHLVDEPSRIRGHRLEETALGLGVQRAEGQRGLAGAGDAAEHDQRVTRNVDIDVPQVVLACAPDLDEAAAVAAATRSHYW